MSNILAIDTSTETTYVAVLAKGSLFVHNAEDGKHDQELALIVKDLLNGAGITPKEINEIVVGAGPGSFTGLRIGFSFAEGMAQALGIQLKAVVSLKAYAEEFKQKADTIICLADARRKEYFCAVYKNVNGDLSELKAPCIIDAVELEQVITTHKEAVLVHTGDIEIPLNHPCHKPKKLAESLIALLQRGVQDDALPLYLRKVAAKTIAEREALKKMKEK